AASPRKRAAPRVERRAPLEPTEVAAGLEQHLLRDVLGRTLLSQHPHAARPDARAVHGDQLGLGPAASAFGEAREDASLLVASLELAIRLRLLILICAVRAIP